MNPHLQLERQLDWLLTHSLQAGVLVVLVLAIQWIFRRKLTSRWRFALWWIVLARLLLPFSPQSALSLFNIVHPVVHLEETRFSASPSQTPPATTANFNSTQLLPQNNVMAQPMPPPVENVSSAQPVSATESSSQNLASSSASVPMHSWNIRSLVAPSLTGLWLIGVMVLSAVVITQSLRFRRKLSLATTPSDTTLQGLLDDCRWEFGVVRPIVLLETSAVQSPALFGLFRLRLLLPHGFGGQFALRELRYIFLHEVAHVKRGDLWLNWLVTGLQILHWFNPLLWFGFARLRADRELACDELALLRAGDNAGTAYGETVVKLLENLSRPTAIPGLVGILEDKKQMRRRISMIVNFRRPGPWSALALVLIIGLAAAALTDAQSNKPSQDRIDLKNSASTNQYNEPYNTINKTPHVQFTATNAPVRQTVTDGSEMKVTVLDDATGQPLNHADVFAPNEASFWGGQENAPRWVTDKNGIAVIHLGTPSSNSVWQLTWFTLSARADSYAPAGASWAAEKSDVRPAMPKEVTIRLRHGTSIGGAVFDEAGKPLAGLQVRVFGTGYNYRHGQEFSQQYPEFWNDSAGTSLPVTDTSGHWQLDDFPKDLENVGIEFVRADGSTAKFRHLVQEINPSMDPQGDPVNLADLLAGKARFVVKAGYELRGIVLNSQGQPVPGVRIKTGYGMVNIGHGPETRSDDSGKFLLQHLDHRQIILTAEAANFAVTSLVADLHSNLTEVQLQMGEIVPLKIHVEDGSGMPVSGAGVNTITYHTEGQILDFSGKTDAQGNLVWTNAPDSSFVLMAAMPAPSPLNQKIQVAAEQHTVTFHLRVGMDQSLIVNARVTDAKTGVPVKLESAGYQTADREGFKWDADITDSGFHLELPASRFRPGMYPSYQFELKAPGYATLITPWRDFDGGDWDASFQMLPGSASGGVVLLPDGKPAAGARIWAQADDVGGPLFINSPGRYYGDRLTKAQADADGKFNLPDVPDDKSVVFTAENGFLSTTIADVKQNPNVQLQPWGQVAGVLKIAGQPKGGISVDLATLQWFPKMGFNLIYTTSTGPDGSFAFDHVPAGEYKLYRTPNVHMQRAITEDHQMPLVVKAGEITKVEYSNPGRAVIGQAAANNPDLSVDWKNDDHTLTLKQPALENTSVNPKDYATEKAYREAYNNMYQSPGRLQQVRDARTYVLAFEPDGSFRADDVPPGTYELSINVTKPDPNNRFTPFPNSDDRLGSLTREVVVPPGDGPFDLGALAVTMKNDDRKKKLPPENFSATTLNGQTINLDQFKGKYVVLAFWASWSERSADGLKELQKLQADLNHDPRVEFFGVNVDSDTSTVAKTVSERGYQWTQATMDSTNLAKVTAAFKVNSLPAISLIDPEGRVIASDLSGDRLTAAVQRALRKM